MEYKECITSFRSLLFQEEISFLLERGEEDELSSTLNKLRKRFHIAKPSEKSFLSKAIKDIEKKLDSIPKKKLNVGYKKISGVNIFTDFGSDASKHNVGESCNCFS